MFVSEICLRSNNVLAKNSVNTVMTLIWVCQLICTQECFITELTVCSANIKTKSDFQYFVIHSSQLSGEMLVCSICTEFFKDPVCTSCGNTYCRACITMYQSEHGESACPRCRKTSGSCSVLHKNITVAEIVEKFKPAQHSSPEDMETDDTEPRLCKKHRKSLVMFCKTDQAEICKDCAVKEHREHEKQYIKVSGMFFI